MVYLDTNVVVWLAGAPSQLSPLATDTLNSADQLLISPIVELELEYLFEVGRIKRPASAVLAHIRGVFDLRRCDRSFAAVVNAAVPMKWTRDPFDRLITAQAAIGDDELLTGDETIRANYSFARW